MQALHTLFLRTTEKMPLARAISSLMVVAAVAASDISAFSWSMCEEYCCRDSHMASCGLLEVVDGYKVREEGKNIIDLHAAPRGALSIAGKCRAPDLCRNSIKRNKDIKVCNKPCSFCY